MKIAETLLRRAKEFIKDGTILFISRSALQLDQVLRGANFASAGSCFVGLRRSFASYILSPRSPRPIPRGPERTTSSMNFFPTARMKASSLSLVPVNSIM